MLKSSLCYYSEAYTLVKGTIAVNSAAVANNTNRKKIKKLCSIH